MTYNITISERLSDLLNKKHVYFGRINLSLYTSNNGVTLLLIVITLQMMKQRPDIRKKSKKKTRVATKKLSN